jgi:hypothetical protein
MTHSKRVANGLAVAALLLIALLAVAEQSSDGKKSDTKTAANTKVRTREASSGRASGRQELNAMNSGHVTKKAEGAKVSTGGAGVLTKPASVKTQPAATTHKL